MTTMSVTFPKRWYVKFPADAYALGPIEAESEEAARAWARDWEGVDRLPAGVEVWPASPWIGR